MACASYHTQCAALLLEIVCAEAEFAEYVQTARSKGTEQPSPCGAIAVSKLAPTHIEAHRSVCNTLHDEILII